MHSGVHASVLLLAWVEWGHESVCDSGREHVTDTGVAAPAARVPAAAWTEVATLAGFCAYLFYFGLGSFGLVGADEPRYAQIAREMLARHDWITPTLNGLPWLEKPALYYWSAMVSYKLFGVSDWAARLPSAVFATAMIAGIYAFVRRFQAGMQLDAALIAASFAAVIGFGRGASTDMPLAATLTLGLLAWYAWRETGRKPWLAIFYFMMALGTLAKGPVAPALAGAIILIFALLQTGHPHPVAPPRLASGQAPPGATRVGQPAETRATRLIADTLWIPGVLLFFAIALPWYVAVQMKTHQFFQVFILQHNLERFGTNLYRHQQPYWYYVPVFVLGALPWTVYVVAAIVQAVRRPTSAKTGQMWGTNEWGTNEWRAFLLLWIAVPLALFTISRSKLPGYILPSVPPCALLLADWMRTRRGDRAAVPFAIFHSLACGLLLGGALLAPYFIVRLHPPAQATTIAAVAAAVIAVAMLVSLRWQGLRVLRFVTLVPVVLGLAFVLRVSAPAIDRTQSARPVALELARLDARGARLAAFNVPRELEFGLDFYRNQPVLRYERGEAPVGDHLLIARFGSEPQLETLLAPRRLFHVGSFPPQHLEFYWVSSGSGYQHHVP
jgi:4-amino-4-deoxy-L-arabinose transferase-like glycosyltransferase